MLLIFDNTFMGFFAKLKAFIWTKHFLKQAGFIILAYFIIISIVVFYLDFSTNHGQKLEVPSLVGKKFSSVKASLEESDLEFEVLDSIYAPSYPEGTILSQDPGPTDSTDVYVKEGRIVRLRLSKKTRLVEVPSLIDKSERFAQSVLKNRGLKYTISYRATSESNGAVLEQKFKGREIQEGTRVPIGSTIQLVVGKNEAGEPVQIPNLVGLTIIEVNERLVTVPSLNLFAVYNNCLTAADSAQAKVISQQPEFLEGVLHPSHTTITIQLDKNGGGGD